MKYVRSEDGLTVDRVVDLDRLNARLGMKTNLDGEQVSVITEGNAADFGLYPLTEEPDPRPDPEAFGWTQQIDNDAPGVFVRRWLFDQTQADLEQAEHDQAEADRLQAEADKAAADAAKQAERDAARAAAQAAEAEAETERTGVRAVLADMRQFVQDAPMPLGTNADVRQAVRELERNAVRQNRAIFRLIKETFGE